MRTWPMIEKVAVAVLQGVGGARVATKVPTAVEEEEDGFVRVSRGPGSNDGVTDSPLLDVESFHPLQETAWHLISLARQRLISLGGDSVDGHLIDSVTVATGPTEVFYGPHVERYVMSMRVNFRKSRGD